MPAPSGPAAPPPRRRRKRRILLWTLAVVVLVVVGYALSDDRDGSTAPRTPEGDVSQPASVSPFDLRAGDCYTAAPLPREDSTAMIASVRAVPCTDPHTAQVVAHLGYAGRTYTDAVDTLSPQDCQREFEAQLPATVLEDQTYVLGHIYPRESTWERTQAVVCVVATESPTTASVLNQ